MESELISSLVAQVEVARLDADVRRLATGERHSPYSPPRHAEAVSYISAVFGESGLATRQQTYKLGNRLGINIVGCKPGASLSQQERDTGSPGDRGFESQSPGGRRPLLVSAHYDTVAGLCATFSSNDRAAGSGQKSPGAPWPVANPGLAHDQLPLQGAKGTAVIAVGTVITHHEILALIKSPLPCQAL